MRKSKIIITGVTGMTGSLMADYLSDLKYGDVYGVVRPSASPNYENLEKVKDKDNFNLEFADLTDEVSINELVKRIKPDYFINFAAHSFVGDSWKQPMKVFDTNCLGVIRCLEALKNYAPECKFYNAGTSEEFGDVVTTPQNENHPLRARSPYGASKIAARQMVKVYRDSYDMFAIQSWNFNHEGIRRHQQFVSRKITKWAAQAHKDFLVNKPIKPITLGNLDAKRDWSDAEDIVRAVWSMLQNREPKEYVVSSGETHTVRKFLELAMEHAIIPFVDSNPQRTEPAEDKKALQINYVTPKGEPLVYSSREFYRPAEVDVLLGDNSKIKEELGWKPKVSFESLVEKMVKHDIKQIGR